MRSKTNILWGFILIGMGIFVLNRLLGFNTRIESEYVYILLGLGLISYSILELKNKQNAFFTFFTGYAGVFFILYIVLFQWTFTGGHMRSPWVLLGPAALFAAGTVQILKKDKPSSTHTYKNEGKRNTFTETADFINIKDTLSESMYNVDSKAFKGGKIESYLAETKLDLTKITMTENSNLEIQVVFGELIIFVPKQIRINIEQKSVVLAEIIESGEPDMILTNEQLNLKIDVKCGTVKISRV